MGDQAGFRDRDRPISPLLGSIWIQSFIRL